MKSKVDVRDASAEVIEAGHLEQAGPSPAMQTEVPPVEPDASRGARPDRRRLARPKDASHEAGTNRAFYPME
jgi:hypothetical protein